VGLLDWFFSKEVDTMSTSESNPAPESSTSAPRPSVPIFRRRSLWLGVLAALVLVVGCFFAGSWLRFALRDHDRPDAYVLFRLAKAQPRGQAVEEDFDTFRKTQAALLKTSTLLGQALRQPEVAELEVVKRHRDPIAWLANSLQVDFRLSPEIMRVGLSGGKPEELATLLNVLARVYVQEMSLKTRNQDLARLESLQRIQQDFKYQLRSKRDDLARLSAEVSHRSLTSIDQSLLQQEFSDCQRELRKVQLARAAAEARGGKDKEGTKGELAALHAQETLLEKEKEKLRQQIHSGHDDADLEILRSEIAQGEEKLKQVTTEIQNLEIEQRIPRVELLEGAVIQPVR
jgi:hypothetical protein